jgi:hypothetical protein
LKGYDMPATVVKLGVTGSSFLGGDNTSKVHRIYFQVVPTGNYAALGDTLDLSVLNPASSYVPLWVDIHSAAGGGSPAFWYGYLPGTTQLNGKFQVKVGATAVDIGAIAYPAGVLADTIVGYADFVRL